MKTREKFRMTRNRRLVLYWAAGRSTAWTVAECAASNFQEKSPGQGRTAVRGALEPLLLAGYLERIDADNTQHGNTARYRITAEGRKVAKLFITPTTLTRAGSFVKRLHRHHGVPPGGLFAVAVATPDDEVVGVAIVGRPVSPALDDGWTVEVTRVATDGTHNACSMLYGAARRASRELGWKRIITYTLTTEAGKSLRGAGWRAVTETGGGLWSRAGRLRKDLQPTGPKIRWEVP